MGQSRNRSIILILLCMFTLSNGTIVNLSIKDDKRGVFDIEAFGFFANAVMELKVANMHVSPKPKSDSFRMGFIVHKTESESVIAQEIQESIDSGSCMLDDSKLSEGDLFLDLTAPTTWASATASQIVQKGNEGLYALIFAHCGTEKEKTAPAVSFNLDAVFYNPGPNYLSAGESALPNLYYSYFGTFLLLLLLWLYTLQKSEPSTVHKVHHMMTALVVLKTFSSLFEAIRYHYIKTTGRAEGWSVVYFIFSFLKGIMLFIVILLIGTGWSLLKPNLNDREKKIIFVVLVLQVIDNIAIVILEETAPGSQGWLTWRDLFHLIDIVCCCAILFPIVWSIRHLRQATNVDGKAHQTILRLTLFRQFYMLVVTYIYFTRIVVLLLQATLPFQLLWLSSLLTEAATVVFYLVTGYKFKPADDNPYLALGQRDEEDGAGEFGLGDGEDGHGDEEIGGSRDGGGGGSGGKKMEMVPLKSGGLGD